MRLPRWLGWEKGAGSVGNEEVPPRLPVPLPNPVLRSHQQLRHLLLRDRYSRRGQNKSLRRQAVAGVRGAPRDPRRAEGVRRSRLWGAGWDGQMPGRLLTLCILSPRWATCASVDRGSLGHPPPKPWAEEGVWAGRPLPGLAPRGRVALAGEWVEDAVAEGVGGGGQYI